MANAQGVIFESEAITNAGATPLIGANPNRIRAWIRVRPVVGAAVNVGALIGTIGTFASGNPMLIVPSDGLIEYNSVAPLFAIANTATGVTIDVMVELLEVGNSQVS